MLIKDIYIQTYMHAYIHTCIHRERERQCSCCDGEASSSDIEREEKQRETELTLLTELMTSYSQIRNEQQELQESLVSKDKELSVLRSTLDTTENMLAEERSAAVLPSPVCDETLSSHVK